MDCFDTFKQCDYKDSSSKRNTDWDTKELRNLIGEKSVDGYITITHEHSWILKFIDTKGN